jgi:hypothetical protein
VRLRTWMIVGLLAAAPVLVGAAGRADPQPRLAPVVDARSGYLLGGMADGRWIDGEAMGRRLRGAARYRVYGGGRLLGQATGSRPAVMEEICPETYRVELSPERAGAEVAVGGAWNAAPRPVARLDPRAAVYREAVRAIVARHGIARPEVRITGLLRADLDGDGRDEVIVSATRGRLDAGIHVDAGDYSVLFVRTVVNEQVRTVMLAEEYHPRESNEQIINEHTVAAVLDVDGDGTMEIVARGRYYEGDWGTVFRVRGTEKTELSSAGCGV